MSSPTGVGTDRDLSDTLAETPVASLDLSRYVVVPAHATVASTVDAMRQTHRSCACIVADRELVGIFTQRDVIHRVVGRPRSWDNPVSDEMTESVRSITADRPVSEGIATMYDWWVRNVPVTDHRGHLIGNLSYWTVMQTITAILASRLQPIDDTVARHGMLSFVEFTGINLHPPITATAGRSVAMAVHQLRNRGVGLVLVVDERGHLAGTLSEFDVLMKIGCDAADLAPIALGEVMDRGPNTLSIRSNLAEALETLTAHEDSQVALLGETGRPVGVASFRDIVAYLESSLDVSPGG